MFMHYGSFEVTQSGWRLLPNIVRYMDINKNASIPMKAQDYLEYTACSVCKRCVLPC